MRRPSAVATAGVLLAVWSALCLVPPAAAEPEYPTQQDVDQARRAEMATSAAVVTIESRLDELAAHLDDLHIAAAQAVEAYNGARLAVEKAEKAERIAFARVTTTAAQADRAHRDLGQLAAAAYRHGGQLPAWRFLLDADHATFVTGAHVLRSVTATQLAIVERWRDAAATAQDAAVAAAQTRADRHAAAALAQDAYRAAERAVADQEQALAIADSERMSLIDQLAAARGTTLALERERQAGLAADRAVERERQAAAAGAAAQPGGTASGTAAESTASTPSPSREAARRGGIASPTPSPAPQLRSTPSPAAAPAPSPAPEPQPARVPKPAPPPPDMSGADRAIAYARAQLGKPYEWGADGPDSFDCSGLTMRAWEQGGKYLPHWSVGQARAVTRVSYSDIRRGDLIFWSINGEASGTYHVALYIGGGLMIHAPRPGKVVEVQSVFYWRTPAFYGRP